MIDWLIVWGVTQAASAVVYPILESLAQDAAKDYSKDFFKDCLKKVIRLPEPNVLGKHLKRYERLGKNLLICLDRADYHISSKISCECCSTRNHRFG